MNDFVDGFVGQEKMGYAKFDVTYNTRRSTQAPSKFDHLDGMQLPNGSILHTVNGFDTLVAPDGGLPDPNHPLLLNEKLPIYMAINIKPASDESQPFGVKETYNYRTATVLPLVSHFYQTHRRYRRLLSERTLASMTGALAWIDYSPLNEIKVNGTLHAYRKFDIIFRTILDKIVSVGAGPHHYILLPQSGEVFSRMALQRCFRELSSGTLNPLSHDPSIFPIIHLLGYVFGKLKNQDVTPYKEDVKLLGKQDPMFGEVHSSSLLERLPQDMLSSINFVFQKDNKAVVYNLADLTRFAEEPAFYPKFYRHIMNLRLNGANVPVEETGETPAETPVAVDEEATTDPNSNGIPLATLKEAAKRAETQKEGPGSLLTEDQVTERAREIKPVTKAQVSADNEFKRDTQAASFEARLRNKVVEQSAPAIQVEPKKESKRNSLMENHLKVTINGKTLGELIQPPASQNIAPKQMTYLTATPEVSYQKSSLASMDAAYQQHVYHHEMAKVVGSLAKHGMFITKIDETKVNTEMDRTTTYRVHLTDLAGKTHHVKYTLPDIDDNGMMKLSGTEYKITRQIANLPICKTSPTRVNLSSYYNKIIVERIQSKRFSYEQNMVKFLSSLKAQGLITAIMGAAPAPTTTVAYDYSAIGGHFTEVVVAGYTFNFDGDGASTAALTKKAQTEIAQAVSAYGIFVGTGPDGSYLFWDLSNKIHLYKDGKVEQSWNSFLHFLSDTLGAEGTIESTPIEWTQAKILNQVIPLVYILGYQMGLKKVLDTIRLDYQFYPDKKSAKMGVDDISIVFADGVLVFNRYPLSRSLIAAGLAWTDLRKFTFQSLSVPDTYAPLFNQKRMSVGVLKGLRGFFDFFVDPITESILEKMHEPITFHELLLRANVMLTDYVAKPSSSIELHRFRRYERFNGIIYNEIMRGLQTHRGNPNTKKSFSINPEAIFQQIVQDATVSPNEVINPVHEVKQRSNFTFTGRGGRNGTSFVQGDRIYPEDGLGVVSESVPDSGKVGITSYLSVSPNIDDIHGIPRPHQPGEELEPTQILSIAGMLMPATTTDDGKRANYTGIQISHYVPNHDEGETLSVRTGYDEVLPHLSSSVFAVSAPANGVVESIDDKQKVLKVRYADKPVESLRKLKTPLPDSTIDTYLRDGVSFGLLIADKDINDYPMGGVFEFTRTTYGKISDRLRCETVDAIPDKDVARRQSRLVQDLEKGHYQALYYIRFTPMTNRIPGDVKSYPFADVYSQNSGSYLLQKLTVNVKVGEPVKAGDILVYNKGFFVPDPTTKQVTFKHGVTATIALIEKSSNHEDACEISREMSDRLKMTPCHQREVITKCDAAILGMVQVGQHVETSSSLCVISDEYLVGASMDVNSENLDIFEKLNRQTPQAGYTGTIRKIRMLYSCDREKLSASLKEVLKVYEKEVRDNFKALNTDPNARIPEKPGWVQPGTKYQGVDFSDNTVVLEFMIDETLAMSEGDKLCIGGANKSIVSHVNEKPHMSESGIPIDILFSTTSVINRIVMSPLAVGISERNMEALKQQALDIYFE
jgi:hypothetical protein